MKSSTALTVNRISANPSIADVKTPEQTALGAFDKTLLTDLFRHLRYDFKDYGSVNLFSDFTRIHLNQLKSVTNSVSDEWVDIYRAKLAEQTAFEKVRIEKFMKLKNDFFNNLNEIIAVNCSPNDVSIAINFYRLKLELFAIPFEEKDFIDLAGDVADSVVVTKIFLKDVAKKLRQHDENKISIIQLYIGMKDTYLTVLAYRDGMKASVKNTLHSMIDSNQTKEAIQKIKETCDIPLLALEKTLNALKEFMSYYFLSKFFSSFERMQKLAKDITKDEDLPRLQKDLIKLLEADAKDQNRKLNALSVGYHKEVIAYSKNGYMDAVQAYIVVIDETLKYIATLPESHLQIKIQDHFSTCLTFIVNNLVLARSYQCAFEAINQSLIVTNNNSLSSSNNMTLKASTHVDVVQNSTIEQVQAAEKLKKKQQEQLRRDNEFKKYEVATANSFAAEMKARNEAQAQQAEDNFKENVLTKYDANPNKQSLLQELLNPHIKKADHYKAAVFIPVLETLELIKNSDKGYLLKLNAKNITSTHRVHNGKLSAAFISDVRDLFAGIGMTYDSLLERTRANSPNLNNVNLQI